MSEPIDTPSNVIPFRKDGQKITNALTVKNECSEIALFGEFGWDICAPEVIAALKAMDAPGKTITIEINSPGGDVFDGYAVGNCIASMDATVVVRVIAFAGSIASFVAACASKTIMPRNSMMMIHEASAYLGGNAEDMRKTAEVLDKINEQIAAAYFAKRARTLPGAEAGEDFRQLMAETAWLTAEETVALGLADEVVEAVQMAACVRADMAALIGAPKNLAVEPEAQEPEVGPAPEEQVDTETAAAEAAAVEAATKAAEEAKAAEEVAAAEAAAAAEAQAKAEAKAQVESDIRAACRVMGAEDKADGFITNSTPLEEVRKALWQAKAQADSAIETDTTPPAASLDEKATYSQRADKVRAEMNSAISRR